MPIDPTIASSVQPPAPVNLLGAYSDALRTGNALTTLQGNRLAIAGAQAQAQAYRDNTDASGNTDFPKMLGELAQLPGGAYALPDASKAVLDRQKTQLDLNQAQLSQTENRTNVYNAALTPLIRLGSNVTPGDVMSTIAGLAGSGFPAGEFAKDAAATMPTLDPSKANDPAAQAAYGKDLAGWVYNHAGRSWGAAVGVNTSAPHYQSQDLGGTVRMVDVNPFTNGSLAAGGEETNKTLTPEGQTDQVKVTDAGGNSYSIPRASLAQFRGQGGLVPNGANPSSSASGSFGSGRYGQVPGMGAPAAPPAAGDAGSFEGGGAPSAGSSPFGSSAPSSGSTSQLAAGSSAHPGMPPGAISTGLGPAATAARTALGTQSGNEAASLFSSAQGVPDRKAQLSSLNADLANAPSGPGSQNQAYWSAFANRNFGRFASLLPEVQSPDQVASAENFEKTAGRFAQSQASTLGVVTNDKLGSAIASNPNLVFSTLGNQGVIHILQGNEDAIAAKNDAWQDHVQSGGDPSNYQGWATDFNKSGFDPRVFWMKNMTPTERSSYIGTLSPSQASTFYGNVRTGISKGWISPSDFAAGDPSTSPGSQPSAPPATAPSVPDLTAPPSGSATNGY